MGHRWQAHPQRRRPRRLPAGTRGAIVLAAFAAAVSASALIARAGADAQRPEPTPPPTVAANLGLPASAGSAAPSGTSASIPADGESPAPAVAPLPALTETPGPSEAPAALSVHRSGPAARGSVGRGSRVVFLGDSYTSGWNGAGIGARGWPRIVASARGWSGTNLAVPGTGFLNPGWTGQPVWTRVSRAIDGHPDVVVVAAGHNDFRYAPSATDAAADGVITRIHRSLPRALLVVVGPIWHNGRPPAATLALRDHLRRIAATLDALFIDPIAEGWFAGSRQALIGADGIHPTDRGHRFMATRILDDLARNGA